jgi:20S proteasome alpha/beta subunit
VEATSLSNKMGISLPSLTSVEPCCLAQTYADLQTSIMAVQFEGGVVIGADSRTTTGSYIVSDSLVKT